MNKATVMEELEKMGKPNTALIYQRHGVLEGTFGVPYSALGGLVKRIGIDHRLAVGLWKTRNHDARVLATKVASPSEMTAPTFAAWLEDCTNYVITDAVSGLAARAPEAEALADKWTRSADEWTSAAGWNVFAILAAGGKLSKETGTHLIARIQKSIHRAANRTRHSMNNALIAIGGTIGEVREQALRAAQRIGPVKVDHGKTGCKTPNALEYIGKLAQRHAGRTRVTGSRMTGRAPAARRRTASARTSTRKP
jgi:3-methyladenine DNA glycosylase AlkD